MIKKLHFLLLHKPASPLHITTNKPDDIYTLFEVAYIKAYFLMAESLTHHHLSGNVENIQFNILSR